MNQHAPQTHTLENPAPGTITSTVPAEMTKSSPSSERQSSKANLAKNATMNQQERQQQQQSSSPAPPSTSAESPHLTNLRTKITTLESQLHSLRTTLDSTHAQLRDQLLLKNQPQHQDHQTTPSLNPPPSIADSQTQSQAQNIVTNHISLLHTYNEIKDIGLGLMGLIADERGVRIKEVLREFGVGDED